MQLKEFLFWNVCYCKKKIRLNSYWIGICDGISVSDGKSVIEASLDVTVLPEKQQYVCYCM